MCGVTNVLITLIVSEIKGFDRQTDDRQQSDPIKVPFSPFEVTQKMKKMT